MMSSKFKIVLVVITGIAVSATAVAFITGYTLSLPRAKRERQIFPTVHTAGRSNYQPIALENIPFLQGTDPSLIALAAFAKSESGARLQEVRVEFPQTHLAVVTITQIGLPDDSVVAIRHRVELVATAEPTQTDKEWKIVWAGQVKCQPQRGSQEWSNQNCFTD